MGMVFSRASTQACYAFGGPVGNRIENTVTNWILPAPRANPGMIEMFRLRDRKPVPELVPWAGEFVGKYLISAIQLRRMTTNPELDPLIREVIGELLSTQADDGYLGPWRKEERLLGHWDLWGHYHAILALLMWHEDTGDTAALAGAVRAADLICTTYLDADRRPIDAGSDEMNLSVIHAFGRLYRHTGNERYLRMMHVVKEDWETPPAGDYFRQGLADVPYYKTPKPRWESLHSIQGMVELYRITGDPEYKTAFMNLWRSIAEHDVHNTGAFSTDEQAVGSPFRHGKIETCCQVAWMAMTQDMLSLTGDAKVADELERGFWNAVLAYGHPSGRWSTYHTPSNGQREASAHSIVFQARFGTPELNCCSVNAPRGLGMLSEWGLMTDAAGALVVNYYGPMEAAVALAGGRRATIRQVTGYPRTGDVRIEVAPEDPAELAVRFRIPGWSRSTRVLLNGEAAGVVVPGEYLTIERVWQPGDVVDLHFDMSVRTWLGEEEEAGNVSLYSGPVLLAFDQKYNDCDCEDMPPIDLTNLQAEPASPPAGPFPPITLLRFTAIGGQAVALCDFASAGAYGTTYASWLPCGENPGQ